MSIKMSNCPHVVSIDLSNLAEIFTTDQSSARGGNGGRSNHRFTHCLECGKQTVNLWKCLQTGCEFVGCGEKYKDHSQSHAQGSGHPLMINLGTRRCWCIFCQTEVHLRNNNPPIPLPRPASATDGIIGDAAGSAKGTASMAASTQTLNASMTSLSSLARENVNSFAQNVSGMDEESAGSADDNSSDTSSTYKSFPISNPVGLVGLKNLGNTCYLNSAVQALSACVPLTNYFLSAYAKTGDEKPPISKYYNQLLRDIWSEQKPSFVIPSTFVQGFKTVNPAFRGYNQQDTQEFLRCFMDRLHEELKKPITYPVCISCNAIIQMVSSEVGGELTIGGNSTQMLFCENCLHSLSNVQRDDLIYESTMNTEEHMDVGASYMGGGANGFSMSTSTGDSGFSDQSSFLSSSAAAALPMRRSPDLYQQQSHLTPGDPSGGGRRSSDRRRTISASSSLSSTLAPSSMANRLMRQRHPAFAVIYSSIISEVFNGRILSSVQCLHCHQTSENSETFQDLSLPIPNKEDLYFIHHQPQLAPPPGVIGPPVGVNLASVNAAYNAQGWFSWIYDWIKSMFWGPVITLNDCLAAFFSADELKGENMYSCEKCQKLRNGLKVSKMQELPEILCIHLKRFRHEYLLSSKVSTYVSFPLHGLNLAPFLSDQNEPALYDLVATICHYGYASGGHYTAYALNDVNKCWYEYDDQIVSQVPASQIQKAEVYVLFYRKRAGADMEVHRKHVKMQSRSARSERILKNVNETKISNLSSFGYARSMENISEGYRSASPSELSTPTIMRPVSHRTRSQARSRSRNSKSVSVGVDANQFELMQYFISKQWLNRFLTFADPGPITNTDFLCQHNRIPPEYVSAVESMAEEVPGLVWDYLYSHFRGGPVVNQLHVCAICQQEQQALENKRTQEREAFQKMNSEFRSQKCPTESYLIDMRWYKQWEAFIRGKTDPPGPIDNHAIQPRGGRFSVSDFDVGQISLETWRYLVSIYGGGPELVHRSDGTVSPPASAAPATPSTP